MGIAEGTSTVVRGNAVDVNPTHLPTTPYGDAMDLLFRKVDPETGVREPLRQEVEAHARGAQPMVALDSNLHPFVSATLTALDRHLPLTLSPDMIWLLIAQGFARHIQENVEAMRDRFVEHPGRKRVVVQLDEFLRGFAGNDWEGVFAEFSAKIRRFVGHDRHALIVQAFSTTGIVERAAVEVTLMSAMQSYFGYVMSTRCGIPEFHIEGTAQDWVSLCSAAAACKSMSSIGGFRRCCRC